MKTIEEIQADMRREFEAEMKRLRVHVEWSDVHQTYLQAGRSLFEGFCVGRHYEAKRVKAIVQKSRLVVLFSRSRSKVGQNAINELKTALAEAGLV